MALSSSNARGNLELIAVAVKLLDSISGERSRDVREEGNERARKVQHHPK
jgi:hypothetical protein